MKTRGILLYVLLFCAVCAHGQVTPPVSFVYDWDGNMTARYVYTINAPAPVTRSVANGANGDQKTEKQFSVALGEQKISIYPNPTRGNITIGVTPLDSRQKNFLRLYDALGRLLLTAPIQSELTPVEIKGPAGVYLLDVHTGGNVSKWKIIKE